MYLLHKVSSLAFALLIDKREIIYSKIISFVRKIILDNRYSFENVVMRIERFWTNFQPFIIMVNQVSLCSVHEWVNQFNSDQ